MWDKPLVSKPIGADHLDEIFLGKAKAQEDTNLMKTSTSLPNIPVPELGATAFNYKDNDMSMNSQEEYVKGLNRRKFWKTEFLRQAKNKF